MAEQVLEVAACQLADVRLGPEGYRKIALARCKQEIVFTSCGISVTSLSKAAEAFG